VGHRQGRLRRDLRGGEFVGDAEHGRYENVHMRVFGLDGKPVEFRFAAADMLKALAPNSSYALINLRDLARTLEDAAPSDMPTASTAAPLGEKGQRPAG
jgi:hypothetical protein